MKKIVPVLLVVIILFITCDVDTPITVIEEPVIEKTMLTILNLPEDVTGENLKQVTVGNVAVCDDPGVSAAVEGTTAFVPLLSPDGGQFSKTGVYLIQLVLENPDKTLLQLNDVPVEFEDGYGTLDLTKIPAEEEPPPPPPRGLRILNLPANTINTSFKKVTIGNTAVCGDFTLVEIENGAAFVPLQLNNGNGEFTKTGIYIVSLTLDVDSLTYLEIAAEDRAAVEFVEGNGILDLADYGDEFLAARFLTIVNMPPNAEADSFQSLNIGDVAKAVMEEIKIEGGAAVVPVTLNNGKEFNKTGMFFVSLRVIIDSLNDIDITKDDFVMVKFENGNGTLDLHNLYGYLGKGYLEGDITNRTNFYEAQVKKETRFEMNGYFYRVITQAPMDNLYQYAGFADTTLYIYAVEADSNVVDYKYVSTMRNADDFIRFRLSAVKPVYNAGKCGYYNGNDRAFWKFIKINGEWRWKTDIDKAFEVENEVLSAPIGNILYKWENVNISPTRIWLEPGVYCFEAAGAKGGDSRYIRTTMYSGLDMDEAVNEVTVGGEGGRIIELVSINTGKYVTVYTGRAGASSSTAVSVGSYDATIRLGNAVSGGGGGAGSFISYDLGQPGDYILCAGGGAGASGAGLNYANFFITNIFAVYQSIGGAGGSVDKGGSAVELQSVGEHNHTITIDSGGDGPGGKEFVHEGYSIDKVATKNNGGGVDGIGNVQINERVEKVFSSARHDLCITLKEDAKHLLTSYLSTIGIGGEASGFTEEEMNIPNPVFGGAENICRDKTITAERFAGGAGGNNRTAARGGNSGNGYVRIYSLN
jgi:hypothetical protein